MKKVITKKILEIDDQKLFEGTLDQVMSRLGELKRKYNSQYDKLFIKADVDYDHTSWELFGERLETDEECAGRLDKEAKQKEAKIKSKEAKINKLKEQLKELSEKE